LRIDDIVSVSESLRTTFKELTFSFVSTSNSATVTIENVGPDAQGNALVDQIRIFSTDKTIPHTFPVAGEKVGQRLWRPYIDNGKSMSSCVNECNFGQGINLDCHFQKSSDGGELLYDTYAVSYVTSSRDRDVILWVGGSGAYIVFVNGERIDFGKAIQSSCSPCYREKHVNSKIRLKQGQNQITIKISMVEGPGSARNGFIAHISCLKNDIKCQRGLRASTDAGMV
jgi:hypothetical protein